jgi:choline dehydrogenase-like flavoprotein
MTRFLVVGSGASGVHFAQTILEHGHEVEMLDVGYAPDQVPHPDVPIDRLPDQLADPLGFFLGERGRAVVLPHPGAKPYGFPPSKDYVFRSPPGASLRLTGFSPLLSHARGGLAEAWTGGSYELRDDELEIFPFPAAEMRQAYGRVAERIGISGADDDLNLFAPYTGGTMPALELDPHSAQLMDRYKARRSALNQSGFYLGRSRVALLTRDHADRQACSRLGRCLLGCPRRSLYAPSHTLGELIRHPRFTYRPGVFVDRVLLDPRGNAEGVAMRDISGGAQGEVHADWTVLAAGALATTGIYLRTMAARGTATPRLHGLMDNRHISIPFVNFSRLGTDVDEANYQFHLLAMALRGPTRSADAHGQITTLKAASLHPIVASMPLDLRDSLDVFRRIRGALGVANVWLADERRTQNTARLEPGGGGPGVLVLDYGSDALDREGTDRAIREVRRVLRQLGCFAPRGQISVLARGSSVHYAGTLPMVATDEEHTCRADGSVRGLSRLAVVDGAGFPWLPAKNITFSLMANATRIADRLAAMTPD